VTGESKKNGKKKKRGKGKTKGKEKRKESKALDDQGNPESPPSHIHLARTIVASATIPVNREGCENPQQDHHEISQSHVTRALCARHVLRHV